MICRQVPIVNSLRLTCLLSVCGGGLKPKTFEALKSLLLHSYGYQHLVTLHQLGQVGLFKQESRNSPFAQCRKLLVLLAEDEPAAPASRSSSMAGASAAASTSGEPASPASESANESHPPPLYGYTPLLARLVHYVLTGDGARKRPSVVPTLRDRLDAIGAILNSAEGTCAVFADSLSSREAGRSASDTAARPASSSTTTIVVVLGGATMAELAALRSLGCQQGRNYIFVVTSLVNRNSFLRDLVFQPKPET
jgi:hypothetical protein